MRLWHKDLIPHIPHQQLVAQWRECCLIYKLVNEKGTPNHTDIYLRECLYNLEEKYIRGGIPENEWIVIFNRFGAFVSLFPPRSLCAGNIMDS